MGIYIKIILFSESVNQLILSNYASLTYSFTSFLISPLASSVPCILLAFSLLFFYLSSYKFVLVSSPNNLNDIKTDVFCSVLHNVWTRDSKNMFYSKHDYLHDMEKNSLSFLIKRQKH